MKHGYHVREWPKVVSIAWAPLGLWQKAILEWPDGSRTTHRWRYPFALTRGWAGGYTDNRSPLNIYAAAKVDRQAAHTGEPAGLHLGHVYHHGRTA